jgi:type I restriction enzyme M protein
MIDQRNVIGGIIGDIAGSVYEFDNDRKKDFVMFGDYHRHHCFASDDSIMTLAICDALMHCRKDYSDLEEKAVEYMQKDGRPYPDCGYGGHFYQWMYSDHPKPYRSFGNGAAMRVGPVAYAAGSLPEVKQLAKAVTKVTHNHPEGLKGAEAAVVLTWYALQGKDKDFLKHTAESYYALNFTIEEIKDTYQFNETCQETVPQAIEAFLESESFEDAIRTAVSVGGDSDTRACITGSIAGAYYGVPEEMRRQALQFLDERLLKIYLDWCECK